MMKNNNILIKLAAVIAAAVMAVSCLEKIPGDYIPGENGMKTLADAEQTVTEPDGCSFFAPYKLSI